MNARAREKILADSLAGWLTERGNLAALGRSAAVSRAFASAGQPILDGLAARRVQQAARDARAGAKAKTNKNSDTDKNTNTDANARGRGMPLLASVARLAGAMEPPRAAAAGGRPKRKLEASPVEDEEEDGPLLRARAAVARVQALSRVDLKREAWSRRADVGWDDALVPAHASPQGFFLHAVMYALYLNATDGDDGDDDDGDGAAPRSNAADAAGFAQWLAGALDLEPGDAERLRGLIASSGATRAELTAASRVILRERRLGSKVAAALALLSASASACLLGLSAFLGAGLATLTALYGAAGLTAACVALAGIRGQPGLPATAPSRRMRGLMHALLELADADDRAAGALAALDNADIEEARRRLRAKRSRLASEPAAAASGPASAAAARQRAADLVWGGLASGLALLRSRAEVLTGALRA